MVTPLVDEHILGAARTRRFIAEAFAKDNEGRHMQTGRCGLRIHIYVSFNDYSQIRNDEALRMR